MKKKLLLLLTAFTGFNSFSQEYVPEKIIIDNESYTYRYHHLETLFNQFPSQRLVESGEEAILERNYKAEFTVASDSLIYLTNIEIKNKKGDWENGKHLLIERPDLTRPLYWISGLFEVGLGEANFKQDSLQPTHERYLVLEFNRGKVRRRLELNALQFNVLKENQWKKYYGTNAYVQTLAQLKEKGMTDHEARDYIRRNILYYSKKFYLRF